LIHCRSSGLRLTLSLVEIFGHYRIPMMVMAFFMPAAFLPSQ